MSTIWQHDLVTTVHVRRERPGLPRRKAAVCSHRSDGACGSLPGTCHQPSEGQQPGSFPRRRRLAPYGDEVGVLRSSRFKLTSSAGSDLHKHRQYFSSGNLVGLVAQLRGGDFLCSLGEIAGFSSHEGPSCTPSSSSDESFTIAAVI